MYYGYSSDPVLDAQRHMRAQELRDRALEEERECHQSNFIEAVRKLDVSKDADWASRVQNTFVVDGRIERRVRTQKVFEVMRECINFGGPEDKDVMQFLANVAYGTDLVNAPQQARALIEHMATTYADNNTGI
jgi:hypothetical protein